MVMKKKMAAEEKAQAVQMVVDHRSEYPSEWAALTSIAKKINRTPETLRSWVRQHEVDVGKRAGVSTDEAEHIKRLERENKELRRANEILKAASVFFATELDGQTRK
jgi:transposase